MNREAHDKAREIVTYAVVDGVQARKNIKADLYASVPGLAEGSFCLKGWDYNESHFLRPVLDLVLGECAGNDTYTRRRRYRHEEGFYVEDLFYSGEAHQWRVRVAITNYDTLKTGFAYALIPDSIMQEIIACVFGDNQEILVRWGW